MGAPAVDSWFLSADGQGKVVSRWLMPYKTEGRLLLQNISAHTADVSMEVGTAPLPWGERSLYFHASWRQQTGFRFMSVRMMMQIAGNGILPH